MVVDRHDYHTFQPLLYQLASGLLETTAVGHSLRDLVSAMRTRHRSPGDRDRSRPRRARGPVRRHRADRLRLPRLRARSRGQLLRHRGRRRARVPDVHAAARRPPQGPSARALGGRRPRPEPRRGRRAERRHRRRRADRSRDRRRARRALPRGFRQGLSEAPAGAGSRDPGRGGPGAVLDVQAEAPRVRGEGARRPDGRGDDRRDGRVGLADPGHAQVRRGAQGAHARLGRRARRATSSCRTLGLELQRGNRIGVGPDLTLPDHPEVYVARRRRRDHRREDAAGPAPARLGRAPVRRARRRDDRPPDRRQGGQAVQVPRQGDDGDDRARRRGRADARWAHDDGQEGAGRVGRGAPRAAADERGPREGGRRLGRRHVHPPARRPDHRRTTTSGRDASSPPPSSISPASSSRRRRSTTSCSCR